MEKDALAGLNAPASVGVDSFSPCPPLTLSLCPCSCVRSWKPSRCNTSSWTTSSCAARSTSGSSSTSFTASRLTVEMSSTSSSCRRLSRLKGNSSRSAKTWSWPRWQLCISKYLHLVFSGTYKLFNFICITWHRVQGPLNKSNVCVCMRTCVWSSVCELKL